MPGDQPEKADSEASSDDDDEVTAPDQYKVRPGQVSCLPSSRCVVLRVPTALDPLHTMKPLCLLSMWHGDWTSFRAIMQKDHSLNSGRIGTAKLYTILVVHASECGRRQVDVFKTQTHVAHAHI